MLYSRRPQSWVIFGNIHTRPEFSSLDASLDRDEALGQLLDDIARNRLVPEDGIDRRYASLCRNRRTKRLHRRQLEQCDAASRLTGHYHNGAPFRLPGGDEDIAEAVALHELTSMVRDILPNGDWQLLWEIAQGGSYEEAAIARQVTVSSLKSRVLRIRRGIRASVVGIAVRDALMEAA
jgi:hypothetical protein